MQAFLAPCPTQPSAAIASLLTLSRHSKLLCHAPEFRAQPMRQRLLTPRRTAKQYPKAVADPGSVKPVDGQIQLMACDVDGTLLTTSKHISTTNVSTIMRLLDETDVIFVLATGKSRAGALKSLGPALGRKMNQLYEFGCPGVYLQGLLVFNLNGELIYEATLSNDLKLKSINIMRQLGIDLIAYSRDQILCEKETAFTRLLPAYHEPEPVSIGSWEKVIEDNIPINKFIYMAEPEHIDRIRPTVESQIGGMATITQAQSNMLEVLPPNTSKGNGVRQLLSNLNIKPSNCLAIGDAENDIELLKMVGYSCAVQNALPSVKQVVKYNLDETNDQDGVSSAILRFLLANPAQI